MQEELDKIHEHRMEHIINYVPKFVMSTKSLTKNKI